MIKIINAGTEYQFNVTKEQLEAKGIRLTESFIKKGFYNLVGSDIYEVQSLIATIQEENGITPTAASEPTMAAAEVTITILKNGARNTKTINEAMFRELKSDDTWFRGTDEIFNFNQLVDGDVINSSGKQTGN